MSTLNLLLDWYHRLFPSVTLQSLERLCLNAWRDRLPPEAVRVLDAQVAAAYFVQRQAGGAKVCFYYPKEATVPLFAAQEPDVHAATVVLGEPGGNARKRMPVKVYLQRGRFFSLEFPKRPTRYLEQHSMSERSLVIENVELLRAVV